PLRNLPDRETLRRARIPVAGELIPAQQTNFAALSPQDACLDKGTYRTVLGLGERLSDTVRPFLHAILFEPRDSPACIGVVLALLLGQHLVKRLIDELERSAYAHRGAIRFKHLAVAREDGHTRANGGLCEVNRSDVAALEVFECLGQLALERLQ